MNQIKIWRWPELKQQANDMKKREYCRDHNINFNSQFLIGMRRLII